MAKVSLNINGRKYALGCDDGEEARLAGLGEKLDAKITELADQFGQIGDLRLLVMAGITLIDENEDLRNGAKGHAESLSEDYRKEAHAAQKEAQAAQIVAEQEKVHAADSLLDAAQRIEKLAERLSTKRGL